MSDTASVNNLLPCPFCASANVNAIEIDIAMWAVVCESCQTIGPTAHDERAATELWNRRPAS